MNRITSFQRVSAVAVALLVALATVAVGFAVGPVSAQEAATEIDSCTTIDEPGRYILTEDIADSTADSCIRIEAGDVYFNGNGHAIDGVDRANTEAIYTDTGFDSNTFTVTDVTITDWNVGVWSESGSGVVSNSTFESNGLGFRLLSGDVTITENTIVDNRGGVFLETGALYTITNNTISSNGAGIHFDDEIVRTIVSGNTITENERQGILIEDFSSGQLSDNVITGNAIGIEVSDSTPVIEDTVANDNSKFDFLTESDFEPSFTGDVRNFEIGSAILSFEAKNLGLRGVDTPPDNPAGLANAGGYVEVIDGKENVSFVALDVHYDDTETQGIEEDSLAFYRFVDGEWEEIPNSSVDTEASIVSANITEFPAKRFVVAPFASSVDGNGDDGTDGATDGDSGSEDTDGENGANAGGDGKDVDNEPTDDGDKDGKHVGLGDRDVRFALGDIVVEGLDLSGPGLPDEYIDERTYEIGGFTVIIDGVSMALGETTYSIGALSVEVEPFTVTFENVTLGDA